MYSLLDILFWINFLYFFGVVFIAFFIPGNLLIKKLKLPLFSDIVLSTVLGFVLWTVMGFLVGYLQIRFFLYIYLLLCILLWLKNDGLHFLKTFKIKKFDIPLTFLVIFGTIIQLPSIWFHGIKTSEGVYFCCGLPDTITHIALTNELAKHFPPHQPAISNAMLNNYHYFSSLAIADLVRIFHLPLINTSFQFMPLLFSFLLGLSVIVLASILDLGRQFKLWFVFLIYFTGDILFLIPFLYGKGINFTYTTLENASTLWISPPRFYSIVVFFVGLSLFIIWVKKKNFLVGICMAIVFASLIGFKVYLGALCLGGFAILGVFYLYKKRWIELLPIIVFFLISFLIYLPVNKNAGGLVFTGFWRFEDFAAQPSLGISSLELARVIFFNAHKLIKSTLFDLYFGFLYIFFSAGILVFGFIQTKKSLKKIPLELTITLISGLIITCIAGFFFIQKTGGANSSQFLISIYLVGSFYAALALAHWLQKVTLKPLFFVLLIIVVIITSTRVFRTTMQEINVLSRDGGSYIDNEIFNSYSFFKKTDPNDTVLVFDENTIDCLYISFLGDRTTYTCTIGYPGDPDPTFPKRAEIRNKILQNSNIAESKTLLKENGISYIYMTKDRIKTSTIESLGLLKVFENSKIVIYKT